MIHSCHNYCLEAGAFWETNRIVEIKGILESVLLNTLPELQCVIIIDACKTHMPTLS